MDITFSLQAGPAGCAETSASVSGSVLTIDGTPYDLNGISWQEGTPFVTPVSFDGSDYSVCIRWQYDPAKSLSDQGTTAPEMTVASGSVPDPVQRLPE